MTKCKISINSNRTFGNQDDAREYLKKLVNAGVLFIKSYFEFGKTRIEVNETTFYQTQREAKIDLKKLVEAGLLYIEVERDER